MNKKQPLGTRCPECGLKIRGKNHEEGRHHQEHIEKRRKEAAKQDR
jgi:DNA-directed RNA polymerase subunit RPC12/RpoP